MRSSECLGEPSGSLEEPRESFESLDSQRACHKGDVENLSWYICYINGVTDHQIKSAISKIYEGHSWVGMTVIL